jgi:NAD(P)-dependent dehydrogenase (short-subunit alcohol dehydrogenase family)
MLQGQNIVIFGATSTIGSHFCQTASSLGAHCVTAGRRTSEKMIPDFRCDLTSLGDVIETVGKPY